MNELLIATGETLYMVVISLLGSYILGIPLGVLVVITDKNNLLPNRILHLVFGWIINTVRSIPFIILLVALIPFTRFLIGTGIGLNAVIVPLIIACAPFVARMVETSLLEVDTGMIDTAKAMGASRMQIIWKVYLPEARASLIRGAGITCIALIGYTAMAGMVDGGGLGQYAIYEGYYRYHYDTVFYIIILLVVLVELFQITFNLLANSLDKSRRKNK